MTCKVLTSGQCSLTTARISATHRWFNGICHTAHWVPIQNCILISSAVFVQLTAESSYTLQCADPFPLKTALSHGESGPSTNIWFLWSTWVHIPYSPSKLYIHMGGSGPYLIHGSSAPPRVHNPNGISIGSAIFARLTTMTHRQTDHATHSVTIGHIYVHRDAMWPHNGEA